MRLLPVLKYDLLFQAKQGIYYLYSGITILYLILLHFVSGNIKEIAGIIMIISDPVLLGFFFIGGIILLEKDNNILQALFVTPIKVNTYILSKVLSLYFVTLISSLAIGFTAYGINFNVILFIITITLSSTTFTFIGMIVASKVNSLNEYMFVSSLCEIVLFLPILNFMEITDLPIFRFIPSDATIKLIKQCISNGYDNIIFSLIILALWCLGSYYAARKSILKNVVENIGGGK